MWLLILQIILHYMIPGAAWSGFFTGIYIVKAIKWHREDGKSLDKASVAGLIALFFISMIAWPWSVYYNLPFIIRKES